MCPSHYLEHCTASYPDKTYQGVTRSLSELVECERKDKDALLACQNKLRQNYDKITISH